MDGMTMSAGPSRLRPPVQASVCAADSIERDSALMLNAVRYHGFGVLTFSVHCAQPPAIIVQMVAAGPSTSIDANVTAKPSDNVEYDVSTGSVIFTVCTAIDAATNDSSSSGCEKPPRENDTEASAPAPHMMAA